MEGITKRRVEKLKRHLLKIEKETGMPLEDRGSDYECPIINFAPSKTSQGYQLCCARDGLNYTSPGIYHALAINLRNRHDIHWWLCLSYEDRAEVYATIRQWLKERR